MSHNPNVRTIYGMSKEPSGFPNRTDSTVTFDNSTLTLSVAPVSGSFEYYVRGVKYTHLSAATKQITDTEGLWHFYFDGYTLQGTQTFTQSIITESAYVAVIYWDAANNQAIYFGEERHGMTMDGSTHIYLHNVNGAVYVNGLGLGDFSIDGTGGISADGYFSVANGIIYDEDIIHTIADGSPQDLSPIASLPVFFREGTSGNWRRKAAEAFPVIYPGSVSGYDLSNTLLAYNDFNGTTWSLQQATSGNYVLVHVLATNDKVHPAIAILGTNQYNNAVSARTGATTELATLSGLPFAELVPVGTVIFQTSNGFTNAIKGRIVSTDTGEDYVDFRNVSALPIGQINDHGNLSGLADADHPASAVYTSVAAFGGNLSSANTTVQSALDTLDDISIANKQLSNLSSTAINTSLLPDTSAVYDLGSVSSTWADGYFVSVYADSLDRPTAGAIAIGAATATSVNVTPRLNVTSIDRATAGEIAVGATTATSIAITPATTITNSSLTGFQVRGFFDVFKVDTSNRRVLVNSSLANATPTATLDVQGGDARINGVAAGKGNGSVATATAFGVSALALNSGANNTALGYQAADVLTSGFANTAVGSSALGALTTGNQNTAVGFSAGGSVVSSSGVTAVGYQALNATTVSNTALGNNSGAALTTGASNVLVGNAALSVATTATRIVAVGNGAASTVVAAVANADSVAIGSLAQIGQTSTGQNTTVGASAGTAITTGTNLTLLGYDAEPSSGIASNEITLGNSAVTTLRCATNTITLISDARDKADTQDLSLGIDFLATVRPVQFKWDRREWYSAPILDDEGNVIGHAPGVSDGSKKSNSFEAGFIAQELDAAQVAANAEWMGLALKNNPDRLEATPLKLFPVVVKACQELYQKNQELEARLAALELLLEPLKQ